ncbi:hypothetical protein [Levilactobacillus zymae]|uniref:Uncharacterized protein n=1 Tax=Levilactobacillus zymae TaxID=267363 RepID=A0A1Y6JZR2_9LACO|nr:hypothetical protein [Levilactobacillus zymae]SMS15385.1 hypothetical protein LZ3411_2335 [Levilactobacillus zymae]
MADTPKKDKAEEPKIDIPAEDVKKAAALILKPGYVTKHDLPKMVELPWATALADAVTQHFLNDDDDHNPYVYFEQFDYAGGDIDSIIFNMDVIPTRDKALELLGQAVGEKLVTPPDHVESFKG